MYKKIELHEIPAFFIETEQESEVIRNAIDSFEKARSVYGYNKLTLLEKKQTRERFCKENKYKLAFENIIAMEIWKQGRTRVWLHERLVANGHPNLTYLSLCQRIVGYGLLTKALKKSIYELLSIH